VNGNGETTTEVGSALEILEGASSLEAVDRASIDMQIATAKRYPRSITKAMEEARSLATMDEETAGSMFYALPRDGKTIEGPSARLAEVMAYSWQNLRADADIIAEDKTHITAMGTCFDLERNVAVRVRVKRRITDKRGRRYKDDMIGVTGNAAVSIALRNAVFKVIPQTFVRAVYQEARKASLGQGGTLKQKRQNALIWFNKAGVKDEDVFRLLEIDGMDDLRENQLITLRGLRTAIQDGETTVEDVFHPAKEKSPGAEDLNEALTDEGAATEEES
jgi:hypothetical protein